MVLTIITQSFCHRGQKHIIVAGDNSYTKKKNMLSDHAVAYFCSLIEDRPQMQILVLFFFLMKVVMCGQNIHVTQNVIFLSKIEEKLKN
jgi:hypothetical protein